MGRQFQRHVKLSVWNLLNCGGEYKSKGQVGAILRSLYANQHVTTSQ